MRCLVLERAAATSERSKAPAVHVRTREVLARWGVADWFLDAGVLRREVRLHDVDRGGSTVALDLGVLDDEADRPGLLVLEQSITERLLLDAVRATGLVEVRFDVEVTGVDQDPDGVDVHVHDGRRGGHVRARLLVGADGASSTVRPAVGLDFDGHTYQLRPMLADVDLDDDRDALPWPRLRHERGGLTAAVRLRPGRWRLIVLRRGEPTAGASPRDAEVQRHVRAVIGVGDVEVVWAERFRIHRRAAARFRRGRVVLAGDAAHVHSPVGGQGMNAGIQDAADLAWKLAEALHGGDLDRLLDGYDVERRGVVVGRISRATDLATRAFVQVPAWWRRAAFGMLATALRVPTIHRRAAAQFGMLDLTAPPSPLLDAGGAAGRRLPDAVLHRPDGPSARLHGVLPHGPALLHLAGPRAVPVPTGVAGVPVLRVAPGAWEEPAGHLHRLAGGAGRWLLVRPDGIVAWSRGEDATDGLAAAVRSALGRGPPATD